jgi:GDP-mannose 6-dehydrogenase
VNVALFGLGYVGCVTAACLAARGHRVLGVDTDAGKVATVEAGRPTVVEAGLDDLVERAVTAGTLGATTSAAAAVAASDVSIVCVGTPSAANGSTDLAFVSTVVEDVGRALAGTDQPHTLVIRSTVPPGTVGDLLVPLLERSSGRRVGTDLHVAMCPEFLREGSSVADFLAPPFLVVGGAPPAAATVRALFGFLECDVHIMDTRSAESLKYASNAFHALKVAFTNELSRLYRLLDVDSRRVMEVFVEDRQLNISPSYLRPGFAFGGSCLPKDVRSLLHLARMNSIDLPVVSAIMASNEMLVRDVADRVLDAVHANGGHNRRVALLGLSFKHLTDDLRESPNVELAEILIGKGLEVRIHDAVVNDAHLAGANLRYVQDRLPHLRTVLQDDPAAAVRGAHVVVVSSADPGAVAAVIEARPPVVLDLNGRLLPLEQLAGYQGVGW